MKDIACVLSQHESHPGATVGVSHTACLQVAVRDLAETCFAAGSYAAEASSKTLAPARSMG